MHTFLVGDIALFFPGIHLGLIRRFQRSYPGSCHAITKVIVKGEEAWLLWNVGSACFGGGAIFLESLVPDWEEEVVGDSVMKFRGCSKSLEAIGDILMWIISLHNQGKVRIEPRFVVMENAIPDYFFLGHDLLRLCGDDTVRTTEKSFTIGPDDTKKKLAFQKYTRI